MLRFMGSQRVGHDRATDLFFLWMTLLSWVAPRAWLSFIELDKAVVHVIRLFSFL